VSVSTATRPLDTLTEEDIRLLFGKGATVGLRINTSGRMGYALMVTDGGKSMHFEASEKTNILPSMLEGNLLACYGRWHSAKKQVIK
ncbi:MAG: hypothetical protein Q8N81_02705, partial [bacterium]|nr:hypothetical protein [bacterium]